MWTRASPEFTSGRKVRATTKPSPMGRVAAVGRVEKASEMVATTSPFTTSSPRSTEMLASPPRRARTHRVRRHHPRRPDPGQANVDHLQRSQCSHHTNHPGLDGVVVESDGPDPAS